jgi:hypothetical protein
MIFLHQANEWTIQSVGAGVVRYTEQIVGVDSAAIDDIERDALRALNKIVEDRGAVAAMQDRLIPGPASERAVLRRLSDIRFLTRGDRTGWLGT